MTVIEMLVSTTVGFLMLATVANLLVRGLDMWTTGQQRASAQQNVLKAMHRMVWEMQTSDVKSVTNYTQGAGPARDGVSFVSAQTDGVIQRDEYGEILWQKFVIFYHDPGTSTIRRQEVAIAPPTRDPDPLKLDTFTPSANDPIVASGITSLSSNLTAWGNPVVLTLHSGEGAQDSFLTSSVVMENGFLKSNPRGHRSYFLNFAINLPTLRYISTNFSSYTLARLRSLAP